MLLVDTFPNLLDAAVIVSLLTLTFLEIVLGIDNIIFISIVSNKLPEEQQPKARLIGLFLAMLFRIALLFTITWIIQLTNPLFHIPFIKEHNGEPIGLSVKDLILLFGGLFLIAKSVSEINHKLEIEEETQTGVKKKATSFVSVIIQILLIDAIFSIDSILTAVGLVENVWIMIMAVIISITIMMIFASPVSKFINRNPSLQILALSFLVVIGVLLIAEAFHQHINKGYIYTAMAFGLSVELLNMRLRRNAAKVKLNDSEMKDENQN
ncbi:MAG: TerC family protein [Chitinophagales bacterium]|nr:TerC family protein [Chitinophagales bacterium]